MLYMFLACKSVLDVQEGPGERQIGRRDDHCAHDHRQRHLERLLVAQVPAVRALGIHILHPGA